MAGTFQAQFEGKCPDCDGKIIPGETVIYDDGALVHFRCPEAEELEPLPGDVCPQCFCAHRGEC